MRSDRVIVVAALGSTQTLAWASSYYLPAILGAPIAAALGLPTSVFFGMFSASLLLSAAISPWVGQIIDVQGGRVVLTASNATIAAGLALLGVSHGIVSLGVAWAILGVGMAFGLYDPAFAALTRLYGRDARSAITGITLIGGFASTIGWPASAWFEHAFGWRDACLIWAGLNLFIAMPLNWLAIPVAPQQPPSQRQTREIAEVEAPPRGAMPILAVYFAATAFVTGAMASQLPRLLVAGGASEAAAIAAGALVGPAQVAARLVEFGLLRAVHPVWSARIAAVLHPLGAAAMGLFGPAGIAALAVLHGAGNGMITIAKGTLPLAIFGPVGYGRRNGILSVPARVALSAAPFVFGLLLDRMGVAALLVSTGLSLAAFGSLLFLRPRRTPAAAVADD
ncbi:MAG TPA: MFS transporter [Stellaceae bacterium]|jgi:MFS family permease|nr:MFS transporter [Stellaceae bacterium]